MSSLTRIVPLAALALCAALPVLASSASRSHKEHFVGTLDTITPSTMTFSGTGVGTHLGKYSQQGSHGYDALGNIFDGEFTTTAADGSTLSGTYSGTFAVQPDGSVLFDVDVLWLTGTGRLAGVTGQGDVVAKLDAAVPGAAVEYFTRATLNFP